MTTTSIQKQNPVCLNEELGYKISKDPTSSTFPSLDGKSKNCPCLSHLWDLDFDDSGCCAVLFIFELPDLFGLDLDVLGVEGRRLRVHFRALQTFKVDFSDADAGIRTRVVLGGGLEVAS